MNRRTWGALTAVTALLLLAPAANAATLSVDDDGEDCPAAPYDSVQDAIDDADPGDTVALCPGTYVEGSGAPGTNALTITKDLTLKGAGADDVSIQPKRSTPTGGQIAKNNPDLRDAVGNIVTIQGGSASPVTVDISGITFDGNGVYVEGGVLFLDAQGSLVRDRVTNTVTSDRAGAFDQPGGWRADDFGFGVAQATQATSPPPGASPRILTLDHTRVDKYNAVGVWIDGATGDEPPLTASGVENEVVVRSSKIVGRNNCPNFVDDGMCQNAAPIFTGPTFGQDGLRVTAGSTADVADSLIASNLVQGTNAPQPLLFPNTSSSCTPTNPGTANNGNLPDGAGVRLIGAGASTLTHNNIVVNAYGVYNAELDGSTANTGTPVSAENNWWGLRYKCLTSNPGPAVSPVTNPPIPENPVNGATIADPTCIATDLTTVSNSDAVDFCPFRNGSQSDPNFGEFPAVDAPLPVADEAPTIELSSDDDEYDRGDTVHLTADAGDDFGVTKVTFFNGLQQLGVVTSPPYTQDFTIPLDAPCGARSFSAVVEDSSGQTASDEISVDVVGPNQCEEPPAAPTVELDNPPTHIPQEGVTVTAVPTVDDSVDVDEVQFFLGTRLVCTDDTGPDYTCNVLANGDEVGNQALRAVVVDTAAQTAEDSADVIVDKFDPDGLSIEMDKDRINKKKVHRTISGELDLPERVDPDDGCEDGTVSLHVDRNGITLFPSSQVDIQPDCSYSLEFNVKEKRGKRYHYDVEATFGGNSVLEPISNEEGFGR
jgi:hypothetical protein